MPLNQPEYDRVIRARRDINDAWIAVGTTLRLLDQKPGAYLQNLIKADLETALAKIEAVTVTLHELRVERGVEYPAHLSAILPISRPVTPADAACADAAAGWLSDPEVPA